MRKSQYSWPNKPYEQVANGFKNRNGQRTGKEADYRFYGPTGVGPMVKPMMS